MRFSIIIPVYNVAAFLRECVESVINQSYKDYEIILVDDGSTDGSEKICDEYKKKYSFIKVIHKKNGGLSSARNLGTKIAIGTYLIFLDSDDYWNGIDCLQLIDNAIMDSDCTILVWQYSKFCDKRKKHYGNKKNRKSLYTINPEKEQLTGYEYRACAWDKAIEADFYHKNGYTFEDGVLSEDVVWSFDMLQQVNKIAFLDERISVYRQRQGSITHLKIDEKASYMVRHVKTLYKRQLQMENNNLKKNMCAYIAEQFANIIISGGTSEVIKTEKLSLYVMKDILVYGKTRRTKIIRIFINVLGIEVTAKLFGRLYILKKQYMV